MLMLTLLRGKNCNSNVLAGVVGSTQHRGPTGNLSAAYPSKTLEVHDHCKIVRIASSLIYVNDPKACTEKLSERAEPEISALGQRLPFRRSD
jgi:hypothetical protein